LVQVARRRRARSPVSNSAPQHADNGGSSGKIELVGDIAHREDRPTPGHYEVVNDRMVSTTDPDAALVCNGTGKKRWSPKAGRSPAVRRRGRVRVVPALFLPGEQILAELGEAIQPRLELNFACLPAPL